CFGFWADERLGFAFGATTGIRLPGRRRFEERLGFENLAILLRDRPIKEFWCHVRHLLFCIELYYQNPTRITMNFSRVAATSICRRRVPQGSRRFCLRPALARNGKM